MRKLFTAALAVAALAVAAPVMAKDTSTGTSASSKGSKDTTGRTSAKGWHDGGSNCLGQRASCD